MRARVVTGILLSGFATVLPIRAQTIELDFSGVITSSSFSSVTVGDTFTADVFYTFPGTPTSCQAGGIGCSYALPEPTTMTVDGSTLSTNTSIGYVGVRIPDTEVLWGQLLSNISGPLASEVGSVSDFEIDFLAPDSILTTAQIPLDFPGLSNWSLGTNAGLVTIDNSGDEKTFDGTILSINESVVTPEPALLPLVSLGLASIALRKRSRSHSQ